MSHRLCIQGFNFYHTFFPGPQPDTERQRQKVQECSWGLAPGEAGAEFCFSCIALFVGDHGSGALRRLRSLVLLFSDATDSSFFTLGKATAAARYVRNFIRHAIEAAASNLRDAHGLEIYIDSDTSGVPGTPHVSETILGKIRECDIFVGDVTFVGSTSSGKKMPNPNVMIEFGYARGVLADRQILLSMNTAFGPAQELPFDLAHLRHPTQYSVRERMQVMACVAGNVPSSRKH